MPRKKKEQPQKLPHEMTTEELAQKVFPPDVLEQLKRIANPEPKQKLSSPPKDKG